MMLVASTGCFRKDREWSRNPGPIAEVQKLKPADPPKNDFDSVLADFQAKAGTHDAKNPGAWMTALSRLKRVIPPDHPRHAEVFRVLAETAARTDDRYSRDVYLASAAGYVGKDEVPDLIALVDQLETNMTLLTAAVKRLKDLKDPRCAEAAMRWWTTRRPNGYEYPALDLVKAIGPPAEKAVQEYARPNPLHKGYDEFTTRQDAIRLLADIGTEDSLPLLKSLLTDKAPSIRKSSQEAIQAIQKRSQ